MGKDTNINWATSTFNPWMGCTKVGPGCDHCYAEARMDKRLHVVQWGAGLPRKRTSAANWREPVKWDAERARAIAAGENPPPHRVFCSSLADVFDNEVDPQWRADLFALIRATPNLTWLLLTKRIGNALTMMNDGGCWHEVGRPAAFGMTVVDRMALPNVWIGATVVNRDEMLRDGPKLKATPAAKHFWSVEPMLGDLGDIPPDLVPDWVIAGGESGPQARPAHPDWFRSLRDQCAAAGVPFLFKQWGEWMPFFDGCENPDTAMTNHPGGELRNGMWRVGTKATGNHLDGRQHIEFPES